MKRWEDHRHSTISSALSGGRAAELWNATWHAVLTVSSTTGRSPYEGNGDMAAGERDFHRKEQMGSYL